MNKKYVKLLTFVLAASLIFTTNNILAQDGQTPSGKAATDEVGSSESAQTSGSTDPAEAAETPGEAADTPAATEQGTLRLSLEDALDLIETGNSSLKLVDSKLLIYEKQYEQALARSQARYSEVDEDSTKRNKLNHKRALWTLENAKHDRENQVKDLKVQISNQYQNILALQQQVKNLKSQLNNVDTYIDQLNLQIDLGLAVESQRYALNAQKSSLEAGLKATQNTITSSMIALKRDLGIDLNREVILTSDLTAYTKFESVKFEEQLAQAITNDHDIQKYEQDIELTTIEYDIAFYYSNPAADQLQISIEDKKATLETLPVTKEVALRTAYNNLRSLENSVQAAKLAVEADKINTEILQKKIEVGISSSIEMIELQNKLLNDQYTLLQNINNYMSAAAGLRNSLEVTSTQK
ncbi:TolC family protein [Desulfitobacterium chlororespirans]|uniref:Outer membrane protein TolC n=1 Tax=Desulfitobacterium chlororespirans DSM 11544 TaxID=1121395 RepID=A0A1M7U955_9FIRM|nr:TolC family protein [Desulfitobacterium chlororespirans]SHN79455.1 Outer membrane protein TolC [Desulfitobacterium chlororespirans DSM 11544]